MIYTVRQKILSLKDNYVIRDESGSPRFRAIGSFFTIADKLQLIDISTGKVVIIRQKLFKFFAEYYFIIDGKIEAVLKEKFKTLGAKFKITTSKGDEFVTKGGIFDYNFSIRSGANEVCRISKTVFTLADSYTVDIHAPNQDHVLIMAICIVLDQVVHNGKDGVFSLLFDLIDAIDT